MLPYKARLVLKVACQKLFGKATKLVSDEAFNRMLYMCMFGRKPDFQNPKTFNEHVCARKLREDAYDFWLYTDKYEARKYVEETIGASYLNECYGVYERVEDIDFDALPERFALRGTHGSGYNIIVRDKKELDWERSVQQIRGWLKQNYYHRCRERNYFHIKPRIMCDRYLEAHETDGLPEMKVFCFAGKAKFVSYNLCKNGKTYSNTYDAQWNYLDVQKGYGHFDERIVPENGDEIIRIAEKLAAPFEFVRVDLYNVDGRIVFSELTFFSGGGMVPFDPPESDYEFGKLFSGITQKNSK